MLPDDHRRALRRFSKSEPVPSSNIDRTAKRKFHAYLYRRSVTHLPSSSLHSDSRLQYPCHKLPRTPGPLLLPACICTTLENLRPPPARHHAPLSFATLKVSEHRYCPVTDQTSTSKFHNHRTSSPICCHPHYILNPLL
ncbi:hypothetical protein QBC45DRAFT_68421 [Copromyces sp. CBS 386.78]|nr:hypothetical protein QBC45DRAFT_68421 [Copromyces sp. CBS 386.78]